jgi:hypothetical protein
MACYRHHQQSVSDGFVSKFKWIKWFCFTDRNVRFQSNYWLVGSSIDEISGAKIPLSKFLGGLFIFDWKNSKNFRIRVFAKEISGELMSKFWLRTITIIISQRETTKCLKWWSWSRVSSERIKQMESRSNFWIKKQAESRRAE